MSNLSNLTHNKRTVPQQARFMLGRTNVKSAINQSRRFADDASAESVKVFWNAVSDLLVRHDRGEIDSSELIRMSDSAQITKDAKPVVTREERLAAYIATRLAIDKQVMDKFKLDFEVDACHALYWSNSTFQSAARFSIWSACHTLLTQASPMGFDEFIAHITSQLLRRAEFSSQSTSQVTNIFHQHEVSAWAQLVNDAKMV